MAKKVTVGEFLSKYLEHLSIRDYFAIPGDFNLILLDELIKNKNLHYVGCCNELNAGYAADGYARANGVSALVVTYCVGGLSCVNAVAGAYAEDLPILVISGGPNSNSKPTDELIHHSLGEIRYDFVRKIYAQITAASVVVKHAREAPMQIHDAVNTCLRKRKPVYIEIACNIVQQEISAPHFPSLDYVTWRSDPGNLNAAVSLSAELLNNAKKPVIVAGNKLRPMCVNKTENVLSHFVEATKYAVALLPDAKGLLGDSHPSLVGIYWGKVSLPGPATRDAVELSDAYIVLGASFTDYNTCGHTTKLEKSRLIQAHLHAVVIGDQVFPNVQMDEFIVSLQGKLKPNSIALDAYKSITYDLEGPNMHIRNFKKKANSGAAGLLTSHQFYCRVQSMILDDRSVDDLPRTIVAETGDAWFGCMKLQLQQQDIFEIQMQYGSIGWSVGATFGLSMASAGPLLSEKSFKRDVSKQTRRVISMIGDGSFQLTAQEVSSIIRYNLNPIIFLLNNFGYTIEEEIHKGTYNKIKNWHYSDIVNVFNAKDVGGISGIGKSYQVQTNGELDEAITAALAYKEGPTLIEVVIDSDDCSVELEQWGMCVSESNSRPPTAPFSQT